MPFIIKNGKYYGSSADGSIDITQAEYDELKASGQVNPSVTYYITDGVYEDESNSGNANNASAISCVDVDGNQSTVQNEIDKNRNAINELNLNIKVIQTTTPDIVGENTNIYRDGDLFGNYIVVGYSILHVNNYFCWYDTGVIQAFGIDSYGIHMNLVNEGLKSKPIYVVLMKIN